VLGGGEKLKEIKVWKNTVGSGNEKTVLLL
jgi:hypothetical protein